MLSSLLRPKRNRQRRESATLNSSYTGVHSSPVAARRSAPEERRRVAADFDHDESFGEGEDGYPDDVDQEHVEDEDIEDEDDEDGQGEATPLLPIFEAAHLGMLLLRTMNLAN